MKLNHDEFTEVAFIFEKENGRKHSEFEKEIIENSKLKNSSANQLEVEIVNGIQNGIYNSEWKGLVHTGHSQKEEMKNLFLILKCG